MHEKEWGNGTIERETSKVLIECAPTWLCAPIATLDNRPAVFFVHSADQAVGELGLCCRSRVASVKRKWCTDRNRIGIHFGGHSSDSSANGLCRRGHDDEEACDGAEEAFGCHVEALWHSQDRVRPNVC